MVRCKKNELKIVKWVIFMNESEVCVIRVIKILIFQLWAQSFWKIRTTAQPASRIVSCIYLNLTIQKFPQNPRITLHTIALLATPHQKIFIFEIHHHYKILTEFLSDFQILNYEMYQNKNDKILFERNSNTIIFIKLIIFKIYPWIWIYLWNWLTFKIFITFVFGCQIVQFL